MIFGCAAHMILLPITRFMYKILPNCVTDVFVDLNISAKLVKVIPVLIELPSVSMTLSEYLPASIFS